MPKNKSSANNGLTKEFCKIVWDKLRIQRGAKQFSKSSGNHINWEKKTKIKGISRNGDHYIW